LLLHFVVKPGAEAPVFHGSDKQDQNRRTRMSDPRGHCRFRAYAYWSSGLLNAGAEAPLYRSLHHEWVLFFVQTNIEIAGKGFSNSAGRSFVALYRKLRPAARLKPCPPVFESAALTYVRN
jgi:hypothetical protein